MLPSETKTEAVRQSRGDILVQVVRQGMVLPGFGLAIGLIEAAAASRALVTLLFGVSRLDPLTYLGVIAQPRRGVACQPVPARRATKVDPMVALGYE